MKKHIPVAFTTKEVINFLACSDHGIEEQIKDLKRKHNLLSDRYFSVIKESRLPRLHLEKISREYNELLLGVCELVSLHKGTPYASSITEVADVVEETMFAIWKYMYDNKMSA